LVATDQEGGSVARIGFGTTGVGNMTLAATGDPENAKQMAAIYGKELKFLGVNTDTDSHTGFPCIQSTYEELTILTDILREDMGFEGVVVSDALDMAAISANFETEDIPTLHGG